MFSLVKRLLIWMHSWPLTLRSFETLWILSTYKFLKNVVFAWSKRLKMRCGALAEGKAEKGQNPKGHPQTFKAKRILVMAELP